MKELLNKIHHADCLDFMRSLPDKCIDLVLTDPPYGIGIDGQKQQLENSNPKHNRKGHIKKDWDKLAPDAQYFNEIFRISKNQIIFGANYFNHLLPSGFKGWIIWDKGQRDLTMSDCEVIFSSSNKPTRITLMNRCELINDDTIHPTQKPLKLMKRLLNRHSGIVLDCFSGSGTTALACHDLGLDFICIEKDHDYYTASVKRLEAHQRQLKLF